MTAAKHTPGPWYVGDINTHPEDGVLGEIAIMAKTAHTPSGLCSPAVALPFTGGDEARAIALQNARLIAAAPEMLEALQEYVEGKHTRIREGNDEPGYSAEIYTSTWAKARAAIAKATKHD